MAEDPAAAYAAGRFADAAALFQARVTAAPGDAGAWLGLGQSLYALGRPGDALAAFDRARAGVVLSEDIAEVELQRARASAALGAVDRAEAAFRASLALREDVRGLTSFGTWLLNESRLQEAEGVLARAVASGGSPEARANLATVLTQSGRAEDALDRLRGADLAPAPVALAWARACHVLRRSGDALGPLTDALGRAAPAHRALLLHARALANDQLGDIPAAAADFAAMHAARGVRPDASALRAMADAVIAAHPVSPHRPPPDPAGPPPLFIVGLPRSGTSLCEQALAAHPDVHAAGERDELRRLSIRLGEALGAPWPACAPRVHLAAAQGARLWYNAVAPRPNAAVVTDKLPDNLFRLGLAGQLFHGARAVWLRRHPLDALLSCWQQAFGPVHAWTASWDTLAEMAAAVDRVGAHWRASPPMPLLELRYEDLVTRPEDALRRVTTHAGLPWHDALLAPERVDRVVRTASILQVREPIHAGSVGRWHRYASVLEPLRDALAARGVAVE